jgi:copper chaperone CopZ
MEDIDLKGSRSESRTAPSRGPVVRRLRVGGMDCRSCENLLIETLGRQPGVGAASADARTGMVSVLADPAVFTDVELTRVIVACGFVPERREHRPRRLRRPGERR